MFTDRVAAPITKIGVRSQSRIAEITIHVVRPKNIVRRSKAHFVRHRNCSASFVSRNRWRADGACRTCASKSAPLTSAFDPKRTLAQQLPEASFRKDVPNLRNFRPIARIKVDVRFLVYAG